MENSIDWFYINDFIRKELDAAAPLLDPKTMTAVLHYLNHDEYEMAFEGLFIDIMQLKQRPNIDFEECLSVAKLLRLDQETVFDMHFWEKFEVYILSSV
jgi:hypothetical protein